MDLGATTALVARITLSAAFGFSTAAKLAAPGDVARGLREFGIPAAPAVARMLPLVELAVALLLLAVPGEAWPAFLAIAVLAVFTGAVVVNLAGGRPAPCPCFGPPRAGDRPVSAVTVARNGVLLGLAVIATASADGASVGSALAASAVFVPVTLVALRRVG